MAIVFVQDLAEGTQELYDKIIAKLDVEGNPPAGMIIHTAGPFEGGWRIVDVWESEEALGAFRDNRLLPAIQEVVGQLPGETRIQISEVYDLQIP
jgi:hypothetical protein